jgi:hypothetical protein
MQVNEIPAGTGQLHPIPFLWWGIGRDRDKGGLSDIVGVDWQGDMNGQGE